ncbi:MAG TPA: hypothetical protein VIN59_03120 [Alphaproteobacteria bacterium]
MNNGVLQRVNGHEFGIAPEGVVFFLDVDETLTGSMAEDFQDWHRARLSSIFRKTVGGLILVTGRSRLSLQKCFPDLHVVSVEHHAAFVSPVRNADQLQAGLTEHVQKLETDAMLAYAAERLKGQSFANGPLPIFNYPHEVRNGDRGVFLQGKQYSIAFVYHKDALSEGEKVFLETIADEIKTMHKMDNHVMKRGVDAVELSLNGYDKGRAVHDYMSNGMYQGRIPYFIGDSNSDAVGMKACHESYGGSGIAVGNGIKPAEFVHHRLPNIDSVWDFLELVDNHPALNAAPARIDEWKHSTDFSHLFNTETKIIGSAAHAGSGILLPKGMLSAGAMAKGPQVA